MTEFLGELIVLFLTIGTLVAGAYLILGEDSDASTRGFGGCVIVFVIVVWGLALERTILTAAIDQCERRATEAGAWVYTCETAIHNLNTTTEE